MKTEKEIENYYRRLNVDVDKINNEINEDYKLIIIAINNIKRKKRFNGLFYNPFNGIDLKEEVKAEFYRLEKYKEK